MSEKFIIKICGIRDAKTLEFAISKGANMVGFLHFSKSPRHLALAKIAELIKITKGRTSSVVLLVNPDWARVEEVAAHKPDFIQLHGKESPQFVTRIIKELHQKVIKALAVGQVEDLLSITQFTKAGATILLDAKPPKDAARPGGLGETFDWKILKELPPSIDFVLSGGLAPDNVAEAIKSTRAIGVDVSSGVESAPGQKDLSKIEQFIANVSTALAS